MWKLTEGNDGRWYGRGASDCKGNVMVHLTALRALKALDGSFPVSIKLIVEGSEEQGTGGLDEFVPLNADLLRADTICVVDTGNAALGQPTLSTSLRGETTVDLTLEALASPIHSGAFGGPAPDPVAGLVQILASLHDADGNTTVDGLEDSGTWTGIDYPVDQFRNDAQDALIEHLRSRVPWSLRCSVARVASGDPFVGSLSGPGFEALKAALEESYGKSVTTQGLGGSIPLCNVLQQTFPDAEIMLYGVEEPACLIHAPNESVAPSEIEHIALAEALFLRWRSSAQAPSGRLARHP